MREHLYDQKSAPPWSFPHGGAAKDVSRMNGDAVQISIVAHQDVHGHQRNVPLPQQLFGQITGAVGGDLDVQKVSPLFVPGAADVGAGAAAAKFPL